MDANDASKPGIAVSPEDIESLLKALGEAAGQRDEQIQSLKTLTLIDASVLEEELRQSLQGTLVAIVADAHYKVGIVAIAALMAHQCKGPDVERVLLAACRSEVLVVRWKAITALGRLGIDSPAAIDALRENLQDTNGNVCRAAAKALCALAANNQDAALALIQSLEDEHAELFRVIHPLLEGVTIVDPSPFFGVIKRTTGTLQQQLLSFLLKHTPLASSAQADALLVLLCQLLECQNAPLCLDVCRGLRLIQFGGYEIQAAVPGLFQLLERPGDAIKMQALLTLKVTTLTLAECTSVLQSVQRHENSQLLLQALGCLMSFSAADMTAPFIDLLLELSYHSDHECRSRVLSMLGVLGCDYPSVATRLIHLLEQERHMNGAATRTQVIDMLDGWGVYNDAYVDVLKICLASDSGGERERALLALGSMGAKAEAALPQVVAFLRTSEASERESAMLAIVSMGDVALAPLMALLDDTDDLVVQRACDAIVALGQDAFALLADGLGQDDAYHRADCAYLLAQVQPKDAQLIPVLLDGLSDPCSWVRRHCAEALGAMAMQPAQVVPALGALLGDPEWDVQAAAAEALASYAEVIRPHTQALMALLEHPHQEVRCAAVIALDTCASPEQPTVTKALQQTASQDATWYIRTLAQESLQGIAS